MSVFNFVIVLKLDKIHFIEVSYEISLKIIEKNLKSC